MCRKIVWCFVFILTLLDISRNSKLTAQGKSHGANIPETLMEGVTFQEWGQQPMAAGPLASDVASSMRLTPAALRFGRLPLGAAHSALVTLTNAANTTLHLASVSGTTPDFHASFFENKSVPPEGNTSFSVVFLPRREGPVEAQLFLHTSRGVLKYAVSAEGEPSAWDVWPMLAVRVPANASVAPLLTLRNPTDRPVQVTEVFSSGGWLGLELPEGGLAAPRDLWRIPPHETRALVRLRVQPPEHAHQNQPFTAYVRINGDMPDGPLLLTVEAYNAPSGEFVEPLQLRVRAAGSGDPPRTVDVWLGSSLSAGVRVEAGVWGARCGPSPPPSHLAMHPPPPDPGAPQAPPTANGAWSSPGVASSLLQALLQPHQPPVRAAQLTLDYGAMWTSAAASSDTREAWCGGWLRLGRAALPYSVRLLRGTLRLLPEQLDFVTEEAGTASDREVRVRSEFLLPVRLTALEWGPRVGDYLAVGKEPALGVVRPGEEARVALLRLRASPPPSPLDSWLTLHTNVSSYTLPLRVYSGRLHLEWEWPNSFGPELRVGAVGTSSTRRIGARVHNRAPRALCTTELRAQLPGATFAMQACGHIRTVPPDHACRCVPAGGWAQAWLTLVAPAREGPLRGSVELATAHARVVSAVSLRAHSGRLHVPPLEMGEAAPYSWARAELVVESNMALRMRVVNVTQLGEPDAALALEGLGGPEGGEVAEGRRAVGALLYKPERLCEPRCYAGIDPHSQEGAQWESRASSAASACGEALLADLELLRERRALYAPMHRNLSLHLHTTQVVQIPMSGRVRLGWPSLCSAPPPAALAGVAAEAQLRLSARNPSRSHPLLLQPVLAPANIRLPDWAGGGEAAECVGGVCEQSREAFQLSGEWVASRGRAQQWAGQRGRLALPLLLLDPGAEIELRVAFAPPKPGLFTAHLLLRNNLTVLEAVPLVGRGELPSFELAARRPHRPAPLLFEMGECSEGGGAAVRRNVVARNTGRVPVRLRDWRVAGAPCAARGFALAPCAPLHLAPNESRTLTLSFTADYTLARVGATLQVRSELGAHEYPLRARVPAALLPGCAGRIARPPWDAAVRAGGVLLALGLLVMVVAAAAVDAERSLRRARASRAPSPPRAPLDLRTVSAPPAPGPPIRAPPPPRRRRPRRLDPAAESRAFERWRAALRRTDDDSSRSSEDADRDGAPPAPPPAADAAPPPAFDPRAEPAPPGYDGEATDDHPRSSADDNATSTDSESTTSSERASEREEGDEADEGDGDGEEPADEEEETARETPPGPDAPPAEERTPRESPARGARGGRASRGVGRLSPSCTPRRSSRRCAEGGPRPAPARPHSRKERPPRRRSRAPPSPLRRSPAAGSPEPEAGDPGEAGETRAAVRWGASWSSVVARSPPAPGAPPPPPLAPIGSDVRRARAAPRRADDSLFYYGGAAAGGEPEPDMVWCSSRAPYGVWAAGSPLEARAPGSWPWPPYASTTAHPPAPGAVRPPPGFGAPPPASPPGVEAAREARPFDPFHSLAAIWSRTALDWRSDAADEDDR